MPKKSALAILVYEVLNPFYIFQIFAVILWMWDAYYYYASCILVISTGSVIISLFETLRNNEEVRRMALYNCQVLRKTLADSAISTVDSRELVPGDLIIVPEGISLPCDLILLTGGAIVNEAMLTGESIPVLKTSLPVSSEELFSDKLSEKYVLFAGTHVI